MSLQTALIRLAASSALACLALPAQALAAPAPGPTASSPTRPAANPAARRARGAGESIGTVRVVAMRLGGAGVAHVRFEISAEDTLFGSDQFFASLAMASGGPPGWDRRSLSEPVAAGAPAEFANIRPGVPFALRALDVFGREVGSFVCEPLAAGETRMVPLLVDASAGLPVRVLDDAGLPVGGARVEIDRGDDREDVAHSGRRIATTDACGECAVDGPLRRGALVVRVSRSWRQDVTQRLEEPPRDGGTVVLRVPSMRPVTVHVTDGNGRPVPVTSVFALDDDGGQRIARSLREVGLATGLRVAEDSGWRIDAVPYGVHRLRVVPAWGAETMVSSALDDVTVVLPTHLAITVSWDAAAVDALGSARLFTVLESDALEHFVTREERDARRAEFALPLGLWTLRLLGQPGTTPIDQAVEVRADRATHYEFHGAASAHAR